MRFKLTLIIKLTSVLIILNTLAVAQTEDNGVSYIFAKKLYSEKMYELAAEQYHQFAEQNSDHPKAAEALFMAGQSYLQINQYKHALKEFVYLITKFPNAKNLDQAQYKIAECFEKNKEFESAAKAYHQVYIFYPHSSLTQDALLNSAIMFRKANKLDDATEVLYTLIEIYTSGKQLYPARLLLANIYIDKGEYERARSELEKVLQFTKIGEINAKAMITLARLEKLLDHIQQAEMKYQELIDKYQKLGKTKPEIADVLNQAYFELAGLCSTKGNYELSNNYITKIPNHKKENRYQFLMANNYFALKDYTNAAKLYEQIISHISNAKTDSVKLIQALYQTGICYAELGDMAKSNKSFMRIIEICQDESCNRNESFFEDCFEKISDNFIKMKQPRRAVTYLRKYLSLSKSEDKKDIINFKIAHLYESEIGDIERAIRIYYDFIDNYPQSKLIDEAQLGLAKCYEKKKDYAEAINEYQNLINRYPASEYITSAKYRIDYIKTYHIVSENVIAKFGNIIQQLTGNQSVTLSPFKVGLIHFNELKDYQSAVKLFKRSYGKGTSKTAPTEEILYYLGRSYQLLAGREDISQQQRNTFLDSANYDFNILLENFPDSKWADRASFHIIQMAEKKLTEKNSNEEADSSRIKQLKQFLINFKNNFPNSPLLDKVNFKLGCLILDSGIESTTDSLKAQQCFQMILNSNSALKPEAEYFQALLLYKTGDIDQAERQLKSFVKYNNDHQYICRAYQMLTQIAEEKGDFQRAEQYLKHIIEHYYYSSDADSAKLKLGKLLLRQNKYSEAVIYFQDLYDQYVTKNGVSENIQNTDSVRQEIIFHLANIVFKKKNNIKADKLYQQYLSFYPTGIYADKVLFKLGELYATNNHEKREKAISYFLRLASDFATSALADTAMVNVGDLFFKNGDYAKATEYFSTVLEKNNTTVDLSYPFSRKIICLYRQGKTAIADQELKKFKKQYKEKKSYLANILMEKGEYYLKTKNVKLAEKIFKQVKSDFKDTHYGAKAEYLMGKLNFILNKDEDALKIMSKLIKKYPHDKILPEVYITLGNFYYLQAKQIEHAMLSYKRAIEQPDIDEEKLKLGMSNLIKCYSDLGMRERALSLIKKYIERFPSADDVFEKKINMGILYYQLNEYDRALQLLRNLKREADLENEPRIQFWIGECYFGKGEFKKAVSEYLKVVYLSKPTKLNWRVTAQYQAGIAYLKAGEPVRAKQIFSRIVIEQGPDSVFGKPAKIKVDEIEKLLANN